MKRINNKGYLTIEIILAATMAFTIAFFLIEITMTFSNASDNYYTDTIFVADKSLASSNIKKSIQKYINENGIITGVDCSGGKECSITYKDGVTKKLTYNESTKEIEYDGYKKKIDKIKFKSMNVAGTFEEGEYIRLVISFDNNYTDSNYDINIMIYNGITSEDEFLVDHIVDLYENATKTKVHTAADQQCTKKNSSGVCTEMSILEEIDYNYATSVNLMNDRLGGETSLDGGNIRYYGSSPKNYIDIGDRTSDGNVIPWRIIGVFDGNVRIVRDDSIGSYSWDTSENEEGMNTAHGINQWGPSEDGSYQGADLMKLLNPGYENNLDRSCVKTGEKPRENESCEGNVCGSAETGWRNIYECQDPEKINNSLYWNSGSGKCYNQIGNKTTECDFSSTGISNEAKEYITDQTIYLGGVPILSSTYAATLYKSERGSDVYSINSSCFGGGLCNDTIKRTLTWTGKVGLLYLSDYNYAVDGTVCNETFVYNRELSSACKDNNWLNTFDSSTWLITPDSNSGSYGWTIARSVSYPKYSGMNDISSTDSDNNIRPVVTLKSEVILKSGTGTKEDPYVIGL